jgi:hypothetical protein
MSRAVKDEPDMLTGVWTDVACNPDQSDFDMLERSRYSCQMHLLLNASLTRRLTCACNHTLVSSELLPAADGSSRD